MVLTTFRWIGRYNGRPTVMQVRTARERAAKLGDTIEINAYVLPPTNLLAATPIAPTYHFKVANVREVGTERVVSLRLVSRHSTDEVVQVLRRVHRWEHAP